MDWLTLWDFNKPGESEQRFRAALLTATGDDALILQTQIARSFGIRGDFSQAQHILNEIAPQIQEAGLEAQARHALESGRVLSSATHPAETQTEAVRSAARNAYLRAIQLARAGQLDDLTIDALHMLAFVDTDPADQLQWGLQALAVMEASTQPAAKKWEGSLRNNVGYALHTMGHINEALTQFELALAYRERAGNPEPTRIARWMVAWTLRGLGRLDEALALQLQLEQECEAAGAPDPYVFEELEILYKERKDDGQAAKYASLREACQVQQE